MRDCLPGAILFCEKDTLMPILDTMCSVSVPAVEGPPPWGGLDERLERSWFAGASLATASSSSESCSEESAAAVSVPGMKGQYEQRE